MPRYISQAEELRTEILKNLLVHGAYAIHMCDLNKYFEDTDIGNWCEMHNIAYHNEMFSCRNRPLKLNMVIFYSRPPQEDIDSQL